MSNQSIHAAAGEHLVVGELLRRGFESYLAVGPTHPGWDILIRFSNDEFRTVQVRAVDWPECTAVQINHTKDLNFLVVVLLNKINLHSRFLVLGSDKVENHLSDPNPERDNNQRTMSIGIESMDAEGKFIGYENRWDIII